MCLAKVSKDERHSVLRASERASKVLDVGVDVDYEERGGWAPHGVGLSGVLHARRLFSRRLWLTAWVRRKQGR